MTAVVGLHLALYGQVFAGVGVLCALYLARSAHRRLDDLDEAREAQQASARARDCEGRSR